ncbi:hypothetical protein KUCAC02_018402 [Chaenocephalus aceratus]|uniref:Uncharacterized protein n=1 Tax=Chaenocephalus aceratus TaxID=36190 RepID=A0ACB9W9B6_CHAAC|nr:hypothetical protein KUCAC02_018402 [Chaenocephalus aceratus]
MQPKTTAICCFCRQTSRPELQPAGRNSSTLSSSKAHAEAPWRTERMPHTSSDYETQEYTRYQLEISWRQLLPEDKPCPNLRDGGFDSKKVYS